MNNKIDENFNLLKSKYTNEKNYDKLKYLIQQIASAMTAEESVNKIFEEADNNKDKKFMTAMYIRDLELRKDNDSACRISKFKIYIYSAILKII